MKTLLTLSSAIILLSSCASLHTASVKKMDIIDVGVIQHPLLADLKVAETKVTGVAVGRKKEMDDLKNRAVYEALKSSDSDVLVEARFETVTKGGLSTVTAKGWPAKYMNFRNVSPSDSTILEMRLAYSLASYEYSESKSGKKGVIGAILGVITLTTLLLIIAI